MQAKRVLHKLLDSTCPDMHMKRREALSVNVKAALDGQSLTVTHLGRAISSEAKEKHCIKRADRLLSNGHLHAERLRIYSTVSELLIGTRVRPVIVVDWSDMDDCKRHFLLRASIAVQGRSLTLYEEAHTCKAKEKPKTHLAFLKTIHAMLRPDCRPIVVSDAGFRVPWFKMVASFGWDWVGRVRNRTFVQQAGHDQWAPCKSLYRDATGTPKALGQVLMARSNPIACQLVLYKGKPKGRVHKNRLGERSRCGHSRKQAAREREPWLLATSLGPCSTLASKAVRLYRLRMQIEEAFRDLKSTRFGLSLELHLTYQVQRLQVLLLIAMLALMVAWIMGKAIEITGQHRQYQANTVKDRLVLSTIFIGLRAIDDARITLTKDDIGQAWLKLDEIIHNQSDIA
jgi:hypothetical protein